MAGFYETLRRSIKHDDVSKPTYEIRPAPPAAVSLLHYLSKEPFTKISDMTKAPGFKSPAEVTKALEWLETNGYVGRESHKVSRRGRKAHFAVLTQKAIDQYGFKPVPGKGTFEHKLYQHLISQNLKNAGFEDVKIEGRVGDSQKSIDVLARSSDGAFIGYEVTLSFDNLLDNVRNDLSAGCSRVVIVTRDKSGMAKAKKLIQNDASVAHYQDRIEFRTMADFFN